jgi:2-keto-4-pentenoate hydratase/2-oxohepta-3-ene-1,7-dioic acid hydratase in catechol pathway
MQIIRAAYRNTSFYASIARGQVVCLDRTKGLTEPIPLTEISLLPLTVPTKIVCLAANYRDHARELDIEPPDEPIIFLKPPSSVTGFRQPIVIPEGVGRVDFEGELCLVIGRPCRNLKPEEVPQHLFGYTCGNDVTARDLQRKDGLFARAKGFDTFAPLGPWIETEVAAPSRLTLKTLVNGEVRQEASTADMIFAPFAIVAFVTRVMTLMPGDIIFTGTPAGVGPLAPGDEVTVEIEGVGKLVNPVISEEEARAGGIRATAGVEGPTPGGATPGTVQ